MRLIPKLLSHFRDDAISSYINCIFGKPALCLFHMACHLVFMTIILELTAYGELTHSEY